MDAQKEETVVTDKQKAKKAAIMGRLVFGLGFGVVAFAVLMILLSTINNLNIWVTFALLFVVFWGLVQPICLIGDLHRINNIYCPFCGAKYDYDDDVSAELIEENTSINGMTDHGAIKQLVKFDCHCPNCGNVTSFTKKFKVGDIGVSAFGNGKVRINDAGPQAKKYFKK